MRDVESMSNISLPWEEEIAELSRENKYKYSIHRWINEHVHSVWLTYSIYMYKLKYTKCMAEHIY